MLRRLFKYDIKALNRFLIIIHAFLLISTLLGRIFLTGRINFNSKELSQTLFMFAFLLYFLIFMSVSMGTYIIIGVRFYKNLFSDEGYLTLTLPVTRGQLLLSKTLSAGIWGIIDMSLILLSGWILIATPVLSSSFMEHRAEVFKELGIPGDEQFIIFIIYLAAISLAGSLSSVIMIHASVLIGQLFSNHKVLGAVVSYFAMSTILSLISTAAMGAAGVFTDSIIAAPSNSIDTFNFYEYMSDILNITIIITLAVTIILYIISHFIINKKINLS